MSGPAIQVGKPVIVQIDWNKIFSKWLPDPTSKLCHYATTAGLLGILQSGNIWATRIQFLNDHQELETGIEKLKSYLNLKFNDTDVQKWFTKRLLARVGESELLRVYCTSFTEMPDQLSQWRGYCGEGGYCIAFQTNRLIEIAQKNNYVFVKCEYSPDKQYKIITDLIDALWVSYQNIAISEQPPFVETEDLLNKFRIEFVRNIVGFKHSGFEEEAEWRLVIIDFEEKLDLKWRIKAGLLIPYIEINLKDQDGKIPLDNIIFGPTSHKNLPAIATGSLLNKLGYKTSLARSVIPYRHF